jgi:hypothetical protein
MKNSLSKILGLCAACLLVIGSVVLVSLLEYLSSYTFVLSILVLCALIVTGIKLLKPPQVIACTCIVVAVNLLFLGLLSRLIPSHMHFRHVFAVFIFVFLVSYTTSFFCRRPYPDIRVASAVAAAVFVAFGSNLIWSYAPWPYFIEKSSQLILPILLYFVVPGHLIRNHYRIFYLSIEPLLIMLIATFVQRLLDPGLILLNALAYLYVPFIGVPASASVLIFSRITRKGNS